MAKQVIGLGTSANDGTGDTPRVAGAKINENFTEVYDNVAGLTSRLLVNNVWPVEKSAHGFSNIKAVKLLTAGWELALADAAANAAIALIIEVVDTDNFVLAQSGKVAAAAHGLTVGSVYYLDETTDGDLTTTAPTLAQPILLPLDDDNILVLNQPMV